MIEEVILNYLNENMDVNVYTEKQEHNPEKYIIIEKTGGSTSNFINSATLAIQSYAESLFGAAVLNEKVKKLMNNASILPDISSSKLNSDYNFTDTSRKGYRYQCVYEVVYF